MIRVLILSIALLVLPACASYPDPRPTAPRLDAALARWEESLTTPSPAKTPEEREELRRSDLALCRQARKTVATLAGAPE